MKEKIKTTFKKWTTSLITLLTLVNALFTTAIPVHANTSVLVLDEPTNLYYTGVSPHTETSISHNIYVLKMDEKKVFCVESGIPAYNGAGYLPESYVHSKKELLSKIAYYGYTLTNQTHYDYATTQVIIWEELGDQFISTTIPNYHERKAKIMAQVNKHDTLPSWDKTEVAVTVGESLTLTDVNGVFSDMTLDTNHTNIAIKQSGQSLTLTPNSDSIDGNITYRKVPQNKIGTSIIYRKPNEQSMVEFYLSDSKAASIKVTVTHLGNIKVTKLDEETGRPLPDTIFKFDYDGTSQEIITNMDGFATINDIPEGTNVTITEVHAPNGYVNAGLSQQIVIEGNTTVEVTFTNREQRGIATLTKTGETPKGIETTPSEYGELYTFLFNQVPIAGVTYAIEATEDIHSIDGSLKANQGEIVATVTTDSHGKWQSPELYLGDYQVVEISAPAGYILDTTPIPFSLTYAGQIADLASVDLSATNDFQSLDLQLFKNEEKLISWESNEPILEEIHGDQKVFGVFTRNPYIFSEDITVPKNSLLAFTTVTDGIASFNLQLPEETYYLKELDAGDFHTLLDTEFEFTFTAENNHATFPIHLYQDGFVAGSETEVEIPHTPILNNLHLNHFSIQKINEQVEFDKKAGISFNYDGLGADAVFTLEDETGGITHEVSMDEKGRGSFKYIPVGIFYLKEKSASSDSYLLSDAVIRIESSKEGIKAYDVEGILLGEQIFDTESTILLTFHNDLKKGTVELTKKDDTTGELLSDTGVRILDSEKIIIAEGRTDTDGHFIFEQLPKGVYYFQEFDAPENYQLDETPLQFEIKENGEVVKCVMTNQKIKTTKELPKTGTMTSAAILLAGLVVSSTALGVLYHRRKNKSHK